VACASVATPRMFAYSILSAIAALMPLQGSTGWTDESGFAEQRTAGAVEQTQNCGAAQAGIEGGNGAVLPCVAWKEFCC
jgi:hypothetical protein